MVTNGWSLKCTRTLSRPRLSYNDTRCSSRQLQRRMICAAHIHLESKRLFFRDLSGFAILHQDITWFGAKLCCPISFTVEKIFRTITSPFLIWYSLYLDSFSQLLFLLLTYSYPLPLFVFLLRSHFLFFSGSRFLIEKKFKISLNQGGFSCERLRPGVFFHDLRQRIGSCLQALSRQLSLGISIFCNCGWIAHTAVGSLAQWLVHRPNYQTEIKQWFFFINTLTFLFSVFSYCFEIFFIFAFWKSFSKIFFYSFALVIHILSIFIPSPLSLFFLSFSLSHPLSVHRLVCTYKIISWCSKLS